MCLSTYRKEAYVAKDDIVVFKRLKYDVCYHDGKRYRKYYTPFTGVPVELGRSFLPKAVQHDSNLTYSDIYECSAGWIHSYWTDLDFDWKCTRGRYNAKVVIPAGTTFRIGLKGDIVSKELYITDEKITPNELRKTTDIINELILSETDSRHGIRVGDIVEYKNDDFKFTHVNDYDDKTGLDIPVGIVACFDDSDNPIAMGLNNYSCLWQSFGNWNKPIGGDNIYPTIAEAKNDMNGYDHTCTFNASNPDKNGYFAYSHCYNYFNMGSKPHDWHLPSLGELYRMMHYKNAINISLSKIAGADLLEGSLWSSTKKNDGVAWLIRTFNGSIGTGWVTNENHYARPFLKLFQPLLYKSIL